MKQRKFVDWVSEFLAFRTKSRQIHRLFNFRIIYEQVPVDTKQFFCNGDHHDSVPTVRKVR